MRERTGSWAAPAAQQPPLLIALFPDATVQAAIQAHRADWWWPRGHRCPPAHRLHLTLLCLDAQDDAIEARLREALAKVPMHPFELALDTSCTWRNDVSVVQPAEHPGLRGLHDEVLRAAREAGLALPPSGWVPHITIARQSEGAARPPRLAPIGWKVREFRLVRSHRGPVFRHELLARYPARC
jgi:2'-5' RNA ligase